MPNWIPTTSRARRSRGLQGLGEAAEIVALNAGGGAVDIYGGDAYYSGGDTFTTDNAIEMPSMVPATYPQSAVFQSERFGTEFSYALPGLAPGKAYTVTLYFAEIYWTETGKRLFDVAINGEPVLSNFDIVRETGSANRAISVSFNTKADEFGQIVVQFSGASGSADSNAKVSAISISVAASKTLLYVGIGAGVLVLGGLLWFYLATRKTPRSSPPLLGLSGLRRRRRRRRW